jgi:lipopolysaccharide assembly LptE-like protein
MKSMNKIFSVYSLMVLGVLLSSISCYTFKDVNFDPNIKSFNVNLIQDNSANSNPVLSQQFTEGLKQKILSESNLDQVNNTGDVEFSGEIIDYSISAVSPAAGETSSLNRLTIRVSIDFTNHINEKDSWTSTFVRFADYKTTENFSSIEDKLVLLILDQIWDDIFKKAFVNW